MVQANSRRHRILTLAAFSMLFAAIFPASGASPVGTIEGLAKAARTEHAIENTAKIQRTERAVENTARPVPPPPPPPPPVVTRPVQNIAKEMESSSRGSAQRLAEQSKVQRQRLQPDERAVTAHTTFKRDDKGNISNYATYTPQTNPRDPKPWQEQKRVDLTGDSHFNKKTGQNIPTPHVKDTKAVGGVRSATPNEIPKKR